MNNRPNVAVVDVNLEGGREGIEVARILRERSDVPIVFVTKPLWGDRLTEAVAGVLTLRTW